MICRVVVRVLVERPPPRVHEEVCDGGDLKAQLLGYRGLHLLGRALRLLEDGHQRAALDVGKHEARLFGPGLLLLRHVILTLAR